MFLDNKSVFFDVSGFNYFLLVFSKPATSNASASQVTHHIAGFFSKEKMSWDNNNLACILVFPPWQRKGLGTLLMGVSYEIARREGILGGPEKPISDLGRKGYKRFWAAEVARWILGLRVEGEEELLVDVEDCSKATWITPEDCLATLRDMNVAEDAGIGPEKARWKKDGDSSEDVELPRKDVQRVRISRGAVRAWVTANKISLEKSCDPNGFIKGYAIRAPTPGHVE